MPHRIACVTDVPEGLDSRIQIIPPPRTFEDFRIPTWGPKRPQCLRRIAMFAPDAAETFGERFVCMDLDCVISGSLDSLFSGGEDFKIFRGTASNRLYNGSMMMLRAGARAKVYNDFSQEAAVRAGRRYVGSDQAWISLCLGAGQPTWGPEHGVMWHGNRTKACRLLFFPGAFKPWDVIDLDDDLVRAHYRDEPRGRALVLGYGPTLWSDVASALRDNRFDAVIAAPEAAAHWPGKVLAIASDDRHADSLAAMHGLAPVWCGRTDGWADAR
jgi:hypothetical protein